MPGTAAEKAARVDQAIRKSASDMGRGDATRAAVLQAAFQAVAMDMGHEQVSSHLMRIRSPRGLAAAAVEPKAADALGSLVVTEDREQTLHSA